MAEIVRERHGLGEVLVEPERAADRARDLRHFEAVGQPGAVMVALVIDEDLGLVLQPAERGRMDDAVAVALKRRAHRVLGLGIEPPAALLRLRRIRRAPRRNHGPPYARRGPSPAQIRAETPRLICRHQPRDAAAGQRLG